MYTTPADNPQTYYAATDGNAANSGAIDAPWTLTAALTNNRARAGDTILLRAGTYALSGVTTTLGGWAGHLVTVKAYSGETVILDGRLIGGNYVRYENLIITDTAFTNRASLSNSTDGITLGNGCEYYYCTVKNHAQGFAGGALLSSYKIHGCQVYYNGIDGNTGHGLYIQHEGADDWARLSGNIVHDNFAWGFHLYGSAVLRNFDLSKNISFENGVIRAAPCPNLMLGGTAGVETATITQNRLYHTTNTDGIRLNNGTGNTANNLTVTDNFNAAAWRNIATLTNLTMQNNALYGTFDPATVDDDFPENTFGDFVNTPDTVFLDALEDVNRANLTIYNKQAQATSIDVNVSTLFGTSGTVKAYNAQDPLVDIQTLTITAGVITVNMEAINRTVETPVGWDAPVTTFPAFGCFCLVKQ